jgi:hypothetical protein
MQTKAKSNALSLVLEHFHLYSFDFDVSSSYLFVDIFKNFDMPESLDSVSKFWISLILKFKSSFIVKIGWNMINLIYRTMNLR